MGFTQKVIESSPPAISDQLSFLPCGSIMKVLCGSILLVVSLLSGGQAITQPDESALTVCFFSNWAIWRPGAGRYTLDEIPGGYCSHIVYAFVGFSETSSNKITEMRPEDDNDPNGLRKFSELRTRFPSAKLLVSVGGWDQESSKLSKMISQKDSREEFITSVISLLEAFKIDGFNIYWMWPGHVSRGGVPADKANFALLLKEMSKAFDQDGKGRLLTVMTTVEKFRVDEGYDVADVCESVDYVYLPAFDMRGFWNNFADVHTPMGRRSFDSDNFANFNVVSGVSLWTKLGCPAGKLVLGVAALGRTYTMRDSNNNGLGAAASGTGAHGEFTKSDGYVAYYEVCTRIKDGWTVRRDPVGNVPYTTSGDQWIGYDDVESLREKVDLIKKEGLAGAMIYALDMDDFRGTCGKRYPLTEFISTEMRKLPSATSYDVIVAGIDRANLK